MLDAAVADGTFPSRAEAVRAGIRVAASYRAAYTTAALTDDETRVLDAAAALAGEALA